VTASVLRLVKPRLDNPDGRLWSATEAARAAGITYRQLDYWVRCDVIAPPALTDTWGTPHNGSRRHPGSGHHRRFTGRQVAILAACGQLARLCADMAALTSLVAACGPDVALPVTVATDATGTAHVDVVAVEHLGAGWVVDVRTSSPYADD